MICKYNKCKKEFTKKSNSQIYCSKKCKEAHKKEKYREKNPLKKKICPYCKKEFIPTRIDQIYCSKSCKDLNFEMGKYRKLKERTVICFCGNTFLTTDNTALYCSDKCRLNAKKIQVKEYCKTYTKKKNGPTKEVSILSNNYYKKYTTEEDMYILDNWDKLTKQEIAQNLKRTYTSVSARYRKLNVKSHSTIF